MENYIKNCAKEFGFSKVGISDINLTTASKQLQKWLDNNYHGEMQYMARHGNKRSEPAKLIPGTRSAIVCSLEYLTDYNPNSNISCYALGRDYHKLIRKRLQKLAQKIALKVPDLEYRCFTDSGPVLEKELAIKAGIGWRGKNSLVLNQQGSWFFLGVIYTNLELKSDTPVEPHCGNCTNCIDSCPTGAIIAPHQIDARRCISYLTIEYKGSIPLEFRPLIGTRIYGCDECQLCCPWNKKATVTTEKDFSPRNNLDNATLIELFNWDETEFLEKLQGSAIRRIGHECWLRNIAVALGNSDPRQEIIAALKSRLDHPSKLVQEHIQWALCKQTQNSP